MDFNLVTIIGRVYGMMNWPLKTQKGSVAEGKLEVNLGVKKENGKLVPIYDEFYIRSYGLKSESIGNLEDGTRVMIAGYLKEDMIATGSDPNKVYSRTYINIKSLEVLGEEKQKYENN